MEIVLETFSSLRKSTAMPMPCIFHQINMHSCGGHSSCCFDIFTNQSVLLYTGAFCAAVADWESRSISCAALRKDKTYYLNSKTLLVAQVFFFYMRCQRCSFWQISVLEFLQFNWTSLHFPLKVQLKLCSYSIYVSQQIKTTLVMLICANWILNVRGNCPPVTMFLCNKWALPGLGGCFIYFFWGGGGVIK